MLIFLRNSRGIYDPTWLPPTEDPDKQISLTELASAAFQVARAMEFLVSRKVGDPLKEFPPFFFFSSYDLRIVVDKPNESII